MKKIESIQDYEAEYRKSIENPEAFWAEIADDFKWRKKWSKILEWDFKKPEIKWFLGAKLNVTEKLSRSPFASQSQRCCYHLGTE